MHAAQKRTFNTPSYHQRAAARYIVRSAASTTTEPPLTPQHVPLPTASTMHESKILGCMLASMSGNVLGAPFENSRHYQVIRANPRGLQTFFKYDFGREAVGYGCYTGDFNMQLCIAETIAYHGQVTVDAIMTQMKTYDPSLRRYNYYNQLLIDGIQKGGDPSIIPQLALEYLQSLFLRDAQTSSDRPDREPYGPSDFGAAVSVAPVGLVYSTEPAEKLAAAVSACSWAHPHPAGIDAALVQASAIAWLCKQDPSQTSFSDHTALLNHLDSVATTDEMRAELHLLRSKSFELDQIMNWPNFWKSKQWNEFQEMFSSITYHSFATRGPKAVALALWLLITSWWHPKQAIVLAAMLGGNAPASAQMTGALVGALHGHEWIPEQWWADLENNEDGRDYVVALCTHLAGTNAKESAEVPIDEQSAPEASGVPSGEVMSNE